MKRRLAICLACSGLFILNSCVTSKSVERAQEREKKHKDWQENIFSDFDESIRAFRRGS